jgi:hypothetical protein
MMADFINLNHMRKSRAKEQKLLQAEENRLKHGITKAEKELIKIRKKQEARLLDGHKRDD